jgi:hypothetical protein
MEKTTSVVSFLAIPIGFISLASYWGNLNKLHEENPNNNNNNKESSCNNEQLESLYSSLSTIQPHGCKYHYKTLESASMTMKLYFDLAKLNDNNINIFLECLDILLRTDLTIHKSNTTYIAVEGLVGSGVTTIINNIITSSDSKSIHDNYLLIHIYQ